MDNKTLPILNFVNSFVNKGHQRSVQAKKNILFSFIIKGLSICISLVLVPLLINYINASRYGIWLTLSSIVAWFSFFDIGLTQGFRNKFAESKAKNDVKGAQIYISTTYAVLGIIFGLLWIIFLIVNNFLNWSTLLKLPQDMASEVSILAIIVFTYFCLLFVLKIIITINVADQKPARASVIDLLGQCASLIFIFILVKTTKGSLIWLGVGLCLAPILAYIGATFYFFKNEYAIYRPKFSLIDFSFTKSLFNLGLTFFIIQIAAVIQFESANIIIARNFGTAQVTSYNIVYKYFGMLTMLFTIFLTPFWSASTEAYFKNDYQWIRNSIKKYNMLNVIIFLLSIVMLALSDRIYTLWLGKNKVHIDFILSFWGFVFVAFNIYGSKYVNLLNGISALKLQFWISLGTPILYVIVAVVLIKYYRMGPESLFIASVVANVNIIVAPIQYYQIIVKNKKGIWVK